MTFCDIIQCADSKSVIWQKKLRYILQLLNFLQQALYLRKKERKFFFLEKKTAFFEQAWITKKNLQTTTTTLICIALSLPSAVKRKFQYYQNNSEPNIHENNKQKISLDYMKKSCDLKIHTFSSVISV